MTLLENAELALLRLDTLPALLESRKIDWYHLPLRAGCIPDESFEAMWRRVAPHLREVLWRGGRIAVHCIDGRSRTAMVTGKLLVELGCPTLDALNRVRGARPRALVSAQEEEFVRRQVPAAEAAFRTQVSLAQPLGLHRPLPAEDDPTFAWSDGAGHAPDQLDLLRAN